jgi:hypothetical protein
LQEKLDKFTDTYTSFIRSRTVIEDRFLDHQVYDILRKQQHLKEVMNTRRSVYLQKRLELAKSLEEENE